MLANLLTLFSKKNILKKFCENVLLRKNANIVNTKKIKLKKEESDKIKF